MLLLVASAIWGLAFVAQRAGAEAMDAFSFNAVRFALGAVSLLPLVAFLDRRSGSGGSWGQAMVPGLINGLFLFGGASLQQIGVEETTAGNAGFVTGLYIVLVPLVGLAFGHRASRWLWVGVALALAGLYLLTVGEGLAVASGDWFVLAGTVFWTGHILALERFSRRCDPIRLAVAQFVVCAVLSGAVALASQPRAFAGMGDAVIPLLYGGLGSVGVAYTLQVLGQRDAKASVAALLLSLEAVFAVIGGVVLLGEVLSVRSLFGCGLMLAGILLAQVGQAPHAIEPGLAPDQGAKGRSG